MHSVRRWSAGPVTTAEELARKLTESTWTLCTGFYVQGHEEILLLNDSTHEDGAGEQSWCGTHAIVLLSSAVIHRSFGHPSSMGFFESAVICSVAQW